MFERQLYLADVQDMLFEIDVLSSDKCLMPVILKASGHLTRNSPCLGWLEPGVTNVTNIHGCIMYLLIRQCTICYLMDW